MNDEVKDNRVASLEYLSKKARDLPRRPGCYLMKNAQDKIIYVGKAKDLRSRVSSYFKSTVDSIKTQALVNRIMEFEFLLTSNEAEAYVLENNLIKRHAPRYNIRLKDDKSYPYLVIDRDEPFPRLKYMRRPLRKKGRQVIGPFATGQHIGAVITVLTKAFRLRDCSLTEFRSRKEPCLLYQMRQCSAPCADKISKEEYQQTLERVLAFFEGDQRALQDLESEMHQHAGKQEFEMAALCRDQWQMLTDFQMQARQKYAELEVKEKNLDVINYYVGDEEVDLVVSIFRMGLLLGQKQFHFKPFSLMEEGIKEALTDALVDYYQTCADSWPETVFVPKDNYGLSEPGEPWQQLLQAQQKSLEVTAPSRNLKSFCQLSQLQAQENQRVRLAQNEQAWQALQTLRTILELDKNPMRLECYDIAIWQGQAPTASRISFLQGLPDKANYRHYHLEKRPEGNNDFAMMKEVLERRLKDGELPDVLIVDGGKGQLSSALAALQELNIKLPVVAIAKEKKSYSKGEEKKWQERLFLPGRSNPIQLSRHPELMRLLVNMRDEAHRFSRKLHHKQYVKEFLQSPLDQLTQLSKGMRMKLRKACQNDLQKLKSWSAEEIAERLDVGQKIAENIYEALQKVI